MICSKSNMSLHKILSDFLECLDGKIKKLMAPHLSVGSEWLAAAIRFRALHLQGADQECEGFQRSLSVCGSQQTSTAGPPIGKLRQGDAPWLRPAYPLRALIAQPVLEVWSYRGMAGEPWRDEVRNVAVTDQFSPWFHSLFRHVWFVHHRPIALLCLIEKGDLPHEFISQ